MSAMSDYINYLKGQLANVGATPANTQAAGASASQKHRIVVMKPGAATTGDDAAAATDTAETPIFVNLTGSTITIKQIKYACGNTGITAGDTNFSTMTIFKRDAAGANQTSLATATTQTTGAGGMGTLTVGQSAAFTLTATLANLTVVNGGVLAYTRTHSASGLVIPGGPIVIEYTED